MKTTSSIWRKWIVASIAVVIVAMPFHGFLSVAVGESVLPAEIAKGWKEILLGILGVATAWDMLQHRRLSRRFLSDRITQLVIAYAALHVVWAGLLSSDLGSAVVGLLLNLRFLVLFSVILWWRRRKVITVQNSKSIAQALMFALFIATVFGLLQIVLLPADFLTNFGYGPDTIEPTFTLDDNDELIRVASFTRGPNVFAAMLVVYCVFITERVLSWLAKGVKHQPAAHIPRLIVLMVALSFSVFFSYSRSGWIAIAVALAVYGLIRLPRQHYVKAVFVGVISISLLVGLLVVGVGRFESLQTLVLHDNPNSGQETSTSLHFQANQVALEQVVSDPLGEGPGSAGPASAYAETGVNIAENYYLQIAQEVGWFGLGLFLVIVGFVLRRLLTARHQAWPAIVASAFCGVLAAALFAHSWADEEVALTLWGLAGLFLPLSNKKQ